MTSPSETRGQAAHTSPPPDPDQRIRLLDELDRLLALTTGPSPRRTTVADLPPEDAAEHHHVLALLDSIHNQHPGAWMPVHTIADYRSDRQNYLRVRRAAAELADADHVQHMRVLVNQAIQMFIRTPTDVGNLDPDHTRGQVNAALAPFGYQVTISPARKIISNFTAVTVTHDGRQYTAYRWTRPYIVTVADHPAA